MRVYKPHRERKLSSDMGEWYERDAAWHAQYFSFVPVPGRKEVAERMILNLKEGKTLLHVRSSDPVVPDRLMLLLKEEHCPHFTTHWAWRTWVPFQGYFDVVKRVCIMTRGQSVVFADGQLPVASIRTVPDRLRLVTMFARWKDILLARQEARAVELRLCLLRLGRYQVLQVLVDRRE